MSDKLALPLDPEFQAVYEQCSTNPPSKSPIFEQKNEEEEGEEEEEEEEEEEDGFQAFRRLAKQTEKTAHRKDFQDGSFNQVEHDFTNAGKLLFSWLTR